MNKKGFTLIELLAVIIIISLLAVLTTTGVSKLIKNSKEKLYNVQIKTIKDAAESWGAENINFLPKANSCIYIKLSYLQEHGLLDSEINNPKTNEPFDDINIKISAEYNSADKLIINYEVAPESVVGCGKLKYENGDVIYLNVDTGKKCTNYIESQSATGTKSGCMKFYAFNDTETSDTVNLILDHNTTATVLWNSSDYNTNGPIVALEKLKEDTKDWVGTETPENYTMDQTGQSSNANYMIDYSTYKARLITANEIAEIAANTGWDEKISSSAYYLDSKTIPASTTCKSGNTSGCKYGWLYDRTNISCKTYGCLNNSDSTMSGYGYWTASSHAGRNNRAWAVDYMGTSNYFTHNRSFCGVRPVITVLKSKLN